MRFEDLESDEDIFWWYMEAVNPVGYFDYRDYMTADRRAEKAEKAVAAAIIYGSATHGVYALTGGGAYNLYNLLNATRPGIREVFVVKQHIAKTIITGGLRVAKKSAPAITVLGMYGAVRSYFHHLADLDWVPDLYTV